MNSLAAQNASANVFQLGPVRRFDDWLHAMPHPGTLVEIAAPHVAVARWGAKGTNLEHAASEPLPPGAVMPSTLETNIPQPEAVRSALRRVLGDVSAAGIYVGLIVPDLVARVFILPFDNLPRRASEALPLLRWRLKKSVPFEAEETLISYMRQAPREDGVDVVTGLARLRIIKEYESLVEPLQAGVVMSSTLATLPLLDDSGPMMLARICGTSLTTAIAREGVLCGYRCTELPGEVHALHPRALLDEIFPVAAYYQDAWSEGLQAVQLSGFGSRIAEFQEAIQTELHCPVSGLLRTAVGDGRVASDATPLADKELDSLIGWSLNRGA